MGKFVSTAVQHMLDRNPETMQESMTTLAHDEFEESLFEKLQGKNMLPETDISILKIVTEQKKKNATNKVVVDQVKPIDPVAQSSVRFNITGKDINEIGGKPADTKDFQYVVTCKLTKEMDGFPRITDLTTPGEPTSNKTAEAETTPAPHKHRKHR